MLLPSLLTGIWSLNAAIISSRTSGNLTSILRVNGVPMRWVSSSILLWLTGRPISIFWVGSDIVANSGTEAYFSSSIPNWKNVIGSTTNLLNLVRSRSNNHPLGNRWYSEDRSTILGNFVRFKQVFHLHRLITLLWPSLMTSFARTWNRYAPMYEVNGSEDPTAGMDLN